MLALQGERGALLSLGLAVTLAWTPEQMGQERLHTERRATILRHKPVCSGHPRTRGSEWGVKEVGISAVLLLQSHSWGLAWAETLALCPSSLPSLFCPLHRGHPGLESRPEQLLKFSGTFHPQRLPGEGGGPVPILPSLPGLTTAKPESAPPRPQPGLPGSPTPSSGTAEISQRT